MDAQETNQGLWSAFQGGRLLAVCLFVSEEIRGDRVMQVDEEEMERGWAGGAREGYP